MVSMKLKSWRTAGVAAALVSLGACAHSEGYYGERGYGHGERGYHGERGERGERGEHGERGERGERGRPRG